MIYFVLLISLSFFLGMIFGIKNCKKRFNIPKGAKKGTLVDIEF